MIYRNSVGARLMLAFAGVIMVFGAAVAISIFRLAAFNAAIADITTLQFKKVETSNAWAASLSESMRHTRNILIMDDKAQIQGEITKVQALAEKRKELADTMTAIVQSAAGKVLLQAALDASTALKPLDEDYLRQVQSGDIKAAKDTLLERSRPAQMALIAALQKLVDHEIEHIHGRADEISAAQFFWGEADDLRDAVKMALESEDALRGAEAAEGAVGRRVGGDGAAADANVGALVRAGGVDGAAGENHG